MPSPSVVALEPVTDDVEAAVRRALAASGFEQAVPKGAQAACERSGHAAVIRRTGVEWVAKTVITGALKNQWGCLSKMRHEYHLVLDDALADINSVCRPRFAIMDGTIGLEGNGPKSGFPKVADRVLASADPVALDTRPVLRKSALKKLFFNTPIFDVCLWGAKNYYRIWTAFEARRCWEVARRHPLYGPQWRGLGPA